MGMLADKVAVVTGGTGTTLWSLAAARELAPRCNPFAVPSPRYRSTDRSASGTEHTA